MNIGALLAELTARMPELEWQLSKLQGFFPKTSLPPGLFENTVDTKPMDYVVAIKKDMEKLAMQMNHRAAVHLAKRIKQKIDVLVGICQQKKGTVNTTPEMLRLTPQSISTRQQWMQTMEMNIETLGAQKKAIDKVLADKTKKMDATSRMTLQAERGEIEKQITLARELLF